MVTLKEHIISKMPQFVLNKENEIAIEALWDSMSEKKGILLIGDIGTGKTILIKALNDYLKEQRFLTIKIADVGLVEFEFKKNGYENLEQYTKDIYCFDDIGVENPIINNYGSKTDIISELLLIRYSNNVKTYATTNLSVEKLKKRYGARLIDRFKEMFKVVYLTGSSHRK